MMARQFESGFYLVERCQRELPRLSRYFPSGSPMSAALADLAAAAQRVDRLLQETASVPASARTPRDA